jgi:glycosyltransferase involved in cell wall biosynthesis
MTQTITAIIPTKNEEHNIKRCIESLMWCDKVQVLFMGNDKTGEIAKSLGAEVIERNKREISDFEAVQENINFAIENAKTDWILRIDADEVVTPELKAEILEILNKNDDQIVAYGVPRKQFFIDDFLRGGDWAYDRLIRLFKKDVAKYEPIVPVHEQFVIKGETANLKHALLHYSHPTLNDVLRKFNLYTSMEAKNLKISNSEAFFKMIFLPPYIFLRWTFWHKGFVDGKRGIVAGILRGFYDFLVYAKKIGGICGRSKP